MAIDYVVCSLADAACFCCLKEKQIYVVTTISICEEDSRRCHVKHMLESLFLKQVSTCTTKQNDDGLVSCWNAKGRNCI